jgi:predicted ATP-dependent endonuclease of OLD family
MISKLTLKNFRCFTDFTLDGIRPITLIAGRNGVGKSTILEGLFLFHDRYSNEIFMKLNNFRGVTQVHLSPLMVWEHLFRNMDANNAIEISIADSDDGEQRVTLEKDPFYSLFSARPALQSQTNVIGTPIDDGYSLKLSYTNPTITDVIHFSITSNGVVQTADRPPMPSKYIHYFSSRMVIFPQFIAEWFSQLKLEKKDSECIKFLQSLDPRIHNLEIITKGGVSMVFADLGTRLMLGVNTLGDGFNKVLSIVLLMLTRPGSVILIDEIENGIHHSFLPKLWETIGKFAAATGSQVIATTHSYECIRAASVLMDDASTSELFRFIRVDHRKNGTIVPIIFEDESFEVALDQKWEVR